MAKYRYIVTLFWEDPDMVLLTPEQKYFYLYLLTRPQSSQCGVSPFNMALVSAHTGYNYETIRKLLKIFEKELKKIKYNPKTKEIAIKNWGKYNYLADNIKVQKHIESEFEKVKDAELIKFVEKVKDVASEADIKKKKELNDAIKRIFEFWKTTFKHGKSKLTDDKIIKIRARLREGYTEIECENAIIGCSLSDHHMGRNKETNPDNTIYDSIDLIFRNGGNLERFISYNHRKKKPTTIKDKTKKDDFDYGRAMGDL